MPRKLHHRKPPAIIPLSVDFRIDLRRGDPAAIVKALREHAGDVSRQYRGGHRRLLSALAAAHDLHMLMLQLDPGLRAEVVDISPFSRRRRLVTWSLEMLIDYGVAFASDNNLRQARKRDADVLLFAEWNAVPIGGLFNFAVDQKLSVAAMILAWREHQREVVEGEAMLCAHSGTASPAPKARRTGGGAVAAASRERVAASPRLRELAQVQRLLRSLSPSEEVVGLLGRAADALDLAERLCLWSELEKLSRGRASAIRRRLMIRSERVSGGDEQAR